MTPTQKKKLSSIEIISAGFAKHGYICTPRVATSIYIAYHLDKPILVEGPAGVGKTELAKTTAELMGLPLIRMQCYEGLDESKALYEWKYGKQLLYTQILKDKLGDVLGATEGLDDSFDKLHSFGDMFFSEHFLEPRPLLRALREEHGSVLLIDEVDKSDHEFEAFLLEILSDYQVSVPEIGTIKAKSHPLVFLTSNNSRDMSDALKRRCLHLYIPFPDTKLERLIVQARVPDVPESLRRQLVSFVQQIRELDLKKLPSVSETIDWARTLMLLHVDDLSAKVVRETLSVFLKFEEDIERVDAQISKMTRTARRESGTLVDESNA